jgi:hypothetical protein
MFLTNNAHPFTLRRELQHSQNGETLQTLTLHQNAVKSWSQKLNVFLTHEQSHEFTSDGTITKKLHANTENCGACV